MAERRRARVVAVAVTAILVLALATGGAYWMASGDRPAPRPTVPTATATIVRTTLSTTTQLSATLGYAGEQTLSSQSEGTVTALPSLGAIIPRGQQLYEVDGRSVYLFYGARPVWRAFQLGMVPGPDVQQLEANLTALGFGAGITVDDDFTWNTERGILAWQRATGQAPTGEIDLGRVLFAPGPLRIADTSALGSVTGPGQPVLTVTSPVPVVTVDIPTLQVQLVHVGDHVTVTLPTGRTIAGTVTDVSAVAQVQSNGSGDQSGGPPQATVPAHVALADASDAAGFDRAPVTVNVVDQQVHNALAVPITALVALSGGGYGVWVDGQHGRRQLVGVTPGLFTDALVQVTGSGIEPGQKVEVPAS
ncbi:hypothetical protein GCM10028798_00180 [Humibacter antri]